MLALQLEELRQEDARKEELREIHIHYHYISHIQYITTVK